MPRHFYLEHFNRCVHVLQRSKSKTVQRQFEFVLNMIIHLPGQANTAIFCKLLYPGCYIHCISRNITLGFYNVTQVNPYSEMEFSSLR